MSRHLQTAGDRHSWRRQTAAAGGRRTAGRVLFTLLAIGLTGLLIWKLWPTPAGRTHLLLISQTAYDRGGVLPVMYGEAAADRLLELSNRSLTTEIFPGRTSDDVARQLRSVLAPETGRQGSGPPPLPDDKDCLIVFVRGYLMQGSDGTPQLACSDLSESTAAAADLYPTGTLPLADLLDPLTQSPRGRPAGPRLVVLDPEPLASDPRLVQAGETWFGALDKLLQELSGPAASNVWVLTTRGPLQAAGWDHHRGMPLSVEVFARGLAGEADSLDDPDDELHLDELVRYMRAQYIGFSAGRSRSLAPQPVLLRGTQGVVDAEDAAAAAVCLARVWPQPAADPAAAPPPSDADQDRPAAAAVQDPAAAAVQGDAAAAVQVRRVALQGDAAGSSGAATARSPEPAGSAAQGSAAQGPAVQGSASAGAAAAPTPADVSAAASSPAADQPGTQAADQTGGGGNPAPAGESASAAAAPAGPAAAPVAAGSSAAEVTFWTVRDRLETVAGTAAGPARLQHSRLGIVGIAPQLWRDAVQRALWAELSGNQADLQRLRDGLGELSAAAAEGLALEQAETALDPLRDLRESWNAFIRSRDASVRVDDRLLAADALQQALAVARTRWWHWLCWSRQWAALGEPPITADSLGQAILQAESTLQAAADGDISLVVMQDRVGQLNQQIQTLDELTAAKIVQLLQRLSAGEPNERWVLARQAEAFLRSPLVQARQRAELWRALRSIDGPIQELSETELAGFGAADGATGGLRLSSEQSQRIGSLLSWECDYVQPADASIPSPCMLGGLSVRAIAEEYVRLAADEASAAWPRLMRIDARDAARLSHGQPATYVSHRVSARPHVSEPRIEIPAQIELDAIDKPQLVSIQIDPDRPQPTRVTARLLPSGSESIAWEWRPPVDVSGEVDGPLATLSVPGGGKGTLSLQLSAKDFGTADRPAVRVSIQLDCPDHPQLTQNIPTRTIRVVLPREDRFRLVVRAVGNIGFSRDIQSGDEGMADGVFLKPYCNRVTPFLVGLQNESGRDRVVRVRLLSLTNPFEDRRISDYWPDMLIGQRDAFARRLTGGGPRVREELARRQLLAEAATLSLPGDGRFVPIAWKPAGGMAPPPTAAAAGENVPATSGPTRSVRHGMVLVVSELQDDGTLSARPDRLFWLFPRPRDPATYVQIEARDIQYSDGRVTVSPRLSTNVDNDQLPDTIPQIDQRDVEVRWVEDDQWAADPNAADTTIVRSQRVNLSTGSPLVVRVGEASNRSTEASTLIRLDVDGWPRALQWSVRHAPEAKGEPVMRRNQLRWGEIVMDYGSRQPQVVPPDLPPPTEPVRGGVDAYFRSPGDLIFAHLMADFSVGSFQIPGREEVQIIVAGNPTPRRFWTDRMVTTDLVHLSETGELDLLTSVTDLQTAWTEANRNNETLLLRAELLEDNRAQVAVTSRILLDGRRPQLNGIAPVRPPRAAAGAPFTTTVSASDDGAGIRTLKIGVDLNGDGEMDAQPPPKTITYASPQNLVQRESLTIHGNITAKLEPGTYRVLAQAWDAVGLASNVAQAPFLIQPPLPAKPGTDPAAAAEKMVGAIRGVISGGYVTRGTLAIDPPPPGVQPGASIDLSGSDPPFAFSNVPEGSYTLRFEGIIGPTQKTYVWKDIRPDVGGGPRFHSLRADARAEEKEAP